MLKKILISLLALLLVFSASTFIWQNYVYTTSSASNNEQLTINTVDSDWNQESKTVDLDNYIAKNQISQEMKDKKHRLILKPELIDFHATLQAPVKASKAELVADTLGVWGISPLPEVGYSTYLRTLKGDVVAVYVENTIAEHLMTSFTPEMIVELQAYRLYNYTKGPRLLLVGVKTVDEELVTKLKKVTNTL